MDREMPLCYHTTMILTLSAIKLRERCEYGAWPRKTGAAFPLPYRLVRYFSFGGKTMETRVAVMSIIVENPEMVETLNRILHEYSEFIIGRMGIPYRKRKISIISIALDAPQNTISSLAGKIGSLKGVSVKTAYSGVVSTE